MTYFADLSVYVYACRPETVPDPKIVNVGWLDASVPFSQGPVDASIVRKLLHLTEAPPFVSAGFHRCPFCPLEPPPSPRSSPVEIPAYGSAEIRVPGEDGVVYAAPTLICHYIERHGYLPPEEFLQAVAKL
jgi:hypothetical protein